MWTHCECLETKVAQNIKVSNVGLSHYVLLAFVIYRHRKLDKFVRADFQQCLDKFLSWYPFTEI